MRRLRLRALSEAERTAVEKLAHSRTAPARQVERARIVWQASQDQMAPAIAAALRLTAHTVRDWVKRFNAQGLAGLEDQPRAGRPPTYTPEQVATVIAAALTDPKTPGPAVRLLDAGPAGGLPERAQRDRDQAQPDRRDPARGGLALAAARDLVRRAGRSCVRRKKGRIESLYTAPPSGSVVVCLDEMGPESAKTFPGQTLVETSGPAAGRAKQEIDYGRRGKGYIFGAFRPATGEAFTRPYLSRSTANWVDFLEEVELWLPAESERVYAILDNLSAHRATDVLLFMLAHPRWEIVFQPKYAAYLNLIEPWWKVLRSLALKGRRFETWEEIVQAVARATTYWNAHRHPFVWVARLAPLTRRTLNGAPPARWRSAAQSRSAPRTAWVSGR